MIGDDNVRYIVPPQSGPYKQWTGHEPEVQDASGGSLLSCADATSPKTSFLDKQSWDESDDALNNGVQRVQAEDGIWSGGVESGVGVGGGPSAQLPVSPSYPFSRMQLRDGLGPGGLGSVSEKCGGWTNGDIFDMDTDFEYSLADEDMVGLPALGMIWHIHLTPGLGFY